MPINGEPIEPLCCGFPSRFDVLLEKPIGDFAERERVARGVLRLEWIATTRDNADVVLGILPGLLECDCADAPERFPSHPPGREAIFQDEGAGAGGTHPHTEARQPAIPDDKLRARFRSQRLDPPLRQTAGGRFLVAHPVFALTC
jgi:hypothetical protein